MDSQLEKVEACLGEKEAMDLEVNPEEIESKVEHEEVPKEEATVETFGALKEQYRDRHLAVGRCQQQNKLTQGNGGSWKKLAAACRWLTHHAIPARRKGHCCQGQGKDKPVPRI
jgi:hypothetical protein